MPPTLIVALDVSSSTAISPILDCLQKQITWFKVGLELFTAEGPSALDMLKEQNKKIFLDLKLHDIPNTVGRAVTSAARLGVSMLTVHASGGRAMMKAAVDAAEKCGTDAPKLIAVTTLTSLNQTDLADIGVQRSVEYHVLALSELALSSGMDGMVTSVHEAASLRRKFGSSPILVTPGIRPCFAKASTFAKATEDRSQGKPAGESAADQKRIATPAMAVEAGSDFLVIGRPILNATDPHAAACAILKEMDKARPRV